LDEHYSEWKRRRHIPEMPEGYKGFREVSDERIVEAYRVRSNVDMTGYVEPTPPTEEEIAANKEHNRLVMEAYRWFQTKAADEQDELRKAWTEGGAVLIQQWKNNASLGVGA
jgi:hypothetical protein